MIGTLLKWCAVAAGVGGVAGFIARNKVDVAVNGPAPKKIPNAKFNFIEVPEDVEIEQVNVVGKRKKKPAAEDAKDE